MTAHEIARQVANNILGPLQFTATLQDINGCRGKKRVVAAALYAANVSFETMADARQYVEDNHVTNFMGIGIEDYLWPSW